jgi:hypothetical protein
VALVGLANLLLAFPNAIRSLYIFLSSGIVHPHARSVPLPRCTFVSPLPTSTCILRVILQLLCVARLPFTVYRSNRSRFIESWCAINQSTSCFGHWLLEAVDHIHPTEFPCFTLRLSTPLVSSTLPHPHGLVWFLYLHAVLLSYTRALLQMCRNILWHHLRLLFRHGLPFRTLSQLSCVLLKHVWSINYQILGRIWSIFR